MENVFTGEENIQPIPLSFKYLLNVIVNDIMGKLSQLLFSLFMITVLLSGK